LYVKGLFLVCQEVPEEPVLSPVSKQVFEKRLIVKFIEENGSDPVTGEPLAVEDLIEIKSNRLVRPRPPSATSIPAILKLLQDEWDATMLHTFTLRQQLQSARQELSHALYQRDAACRVIARLNKELQAAREALASLKPQGGAYPPVTEEVEPEEEMEQAPAESIEEIMIKLTETASALTAERKKKGKKMPEDLTPPDIISSFQQQASHPGLHSASVPGILSLDISPDSQHVVTGGNDKNVIVFDHSSEKIVSMLKGHTKKVTHVVYHSSGSTVVSASPDSTIRVWDIAGSALKTTVKAHGGAVTGISLHPTGDYLLSSSLDQHWAFSDIRNGVVVAKGTDSASPVGLTSSQFHPDGLIFGTGTEDSVIKIWDLKESTNVANFPGHSGAVTCISFSENGYYLATAAEDSTVKLWDLRKLKNFRTIELSDNYEVKSLTFDRSGAYLAIAGTDIQIHQSKQWNILKTLTDHVGTVNCVRFGMNASFVASVGMDRTLKFFSP
jgi:pre-mRNA-processing factor 19